MYRRLSNLRMLSWKSFDCHQGIDDEASAGWTTYGTSSGNDQTSSGERNVEACRLSARFSSFIEGGSGRITPCGPAIQLNGRRSFPTASWSSVSPSINALGLGGQPGT